MAKRKHRRIYIAGAITGADIQHQILLSGFVNAWLVNRGWAVFNPFGSCMNDACLVVPNEKWYAQDLEWLADCDALVLLPGWETSRGSNRELAQALEDDLEVYTWQNTLVPFTGKVMLSMEKGAEA